MTSKLATMVFILVFLGSSLQVAISTIYDVKPDSTDYNDPYTLHYYQNNLNFSSNMQLKFHPGLFRLKMPLIIKNVTTFSLVGSSYSPTTIFCNGSEAGVLIAYSSNISIVNIAINNCSYNFKTLYRSTRSNVIMSNVMIVMCANVSVQNSTFLAPIPWKFGFSIHDPIGYSSIHQISSSAILIDVQNASSNINVNVTKFQNIQPTRGYAISVVIHHHSKTVNILLSQIKIN